ncbi:trypsin delta-like [Helicoverpa zea]|uniref:trypsin delta-like n=1 Tax=Helicoverpa zea TaxID=7113 RepID=UPI001F5AF53A|nr:trypsin delta-like [Helicoverpa zea]
MNKIVILCVIAFYGASYSVEAASRIIGGTAANENQFKYMVSLQNRSEVDLLTRGHRCGGALITLSHALTAASCLHNNNQLIVASQFRLFAGSSRLNNDDNSYRVRNVASFTIHPQFVPSQRFNNDIAVIATVSPFSSIAVSVLRLPTEDISVTHLAVCHTPGWGAQNASASASYQLMFIQSRVTLSSHCATAYYGMGTTIAMQPNMLCAMPITNSTGCHGDLGNPLVCGDYLQGVLFLSKDCTSPLLTAVPDVYSRVFSHVAWLNETVFGVSDETSGACTYQAGVGLLAIFALVQIVTSMS